MNGENHIYDNTVFHILCKLNNINICVLNQDDDNWSFTIKKSDINNIKFILHSS